MSLLCLPVSGVCVGSHPVTRNRRCNPDMAGRLALENEALLASERALSLDTLIPEAHVVRGRMLGTGTSRSRGASLPASSCSSSAMVSALGDDSTSVHRVRPRAGHKRRRAIATLEEYAIVAPGDSPSQAAVRSAVAVQHGQNFCVGDSVRGGCCVVGFALSGAVALVSWLVRLGRAR